MSKPTKQDESRSLSSHGRSRRDMLAGWLSSARASHGSGAEAGPETWDNAETWLDMLSQPGPEHHRLDALAGNWAITIKLWDEGPDEEPLELEGFVRRQWVLRGRFLREERFENVTGDDVYHSLGYLGYNRATGVYEHVSMNTESTAIQLSTGRFDPSCNVIRTFGSFIDPASGFITQTRTEITVSDHDNHRLVGYATEEDGREYKEFDIVHTRKQAEGEEASP